jgi:Transglutaminase-like superfamily
MPAGAISKLRTHVETPRDVSLLIRMGLWSIALHVLKHAVPLPVLVRMIRLPPSGTYAGLEDAERVHEQIATLARWACRATRWSRRGRCLEQGLVTYRYLSQLDADPYLMVGVRSEDGTRGSRGHAWVEAGGRVIGEDDESVAPFTRILAFDPNGDLLRDAPVTAR